MIENKQSVNDKDEDKFKLEEDKSVLLQKNKEIEQPKKEVDINSMIVQHEIIKSSSMK